MSNDRDRPKTSPAKPPDAEETTLSGATSVDQSRVRTPEDGCSRVDTLPEEFAKLLGHKRPEAGEVIGNRFKLIEKLGGGAMGDVFIAENVAINVRVAVKLLKPDLLADSHFRQRFQREAQAIASIEHPNVARFFDLVVGDPTFLVMEYVRGPTLSAHLRDIGRLPVERAVRIAIKLCRALSAAHAVGVIHRDLKPANVILVAPTAGEAPKVPKLIDFGLAKVVARGENSLTRTGQLIGTPQYMSPEQIAGKDVGVHSDVYSLGCLTYEMLVGKPPFVGDDDFRILYQQVHDPPEPLRKHLPDAPEALEAVLARALAKDPAERYGSTVELASALKSTLEASTNSVSRPRSEGSLDPFGDSEVRTRVYGEVAEAPSPPPPPRSLLVPFTVTAVAVVLIGFLGGYLASRMGPRPASPSPRTTLFLMSEPAGAVVEVDGKALPQTTPTMTTDLAPGRHRVKIQRLGLAPITQTVSLRAAERSTVLVTLPPLNHKVEVRSVPDGAALYLDNRLVMGETPTTVELTDDEFHELMFEKRGYETKRYSLTPDDRAPQITVTLKAEKAPRGTVIVDGSSSGEVWIDDKDTGYTTPTLGIEVSTGPHTVVVRDGMARTLPASFFVAQGQTVRVIYTPGAPPVIAGATQTEAAAR
jgi:serine/threonine protein kinase